MSDRTRDGKHRRGGRVENAFFYGPKNGPTCNCANDEDFPSHPGGPGGPGGPGQPGQPGQPSNPPGSGSPPQP